MLGEAVGRSVAVESHFKFFSVGLEFFQVKSKEIKTGMVRRPSW